MAVTSTEDLSFCVYLARRIRKQAQALTARWVSTLRVESGVEAEEAVPEEELLNQIPDVLERVADFVSDPDALPFDAVVAQDLGRLAELRRRRGLDLQELLQEYRALSELLREVAEEAAEEYPGPPELRDVARALGRLIDAINLMGVETARSYRLWRERYDQEWRDLLDSYEESLSYELGNRLGAAETAIQVLISQMPDAEGRRSGLYSLIRESIREGCRTIDDIAALGQPLSREIEAGISLWLLVKESVRLAGKEAHAGGISVSIEGEVPDVRVPGPPARIALANLLSNAIRYHGEGPDDRWVRVSTLRDEGSRTVEITVEDNGPGIPEGIREKVFDYQYRNEGREEGSGLGLAISREVIEGVGGSISLSEGTAGGARFTLRVPEHDIIRPPTAADDGGGTETPSSKRLR